LFNCGVECPYCEDCDIPDENKKRKRKEIVKSSKQRDGEIN
jgi:hypothetical protein